MAAVEQTLAFSSRVIPIVSSPIKFGHILYLISDYKISISVLEQSSVKGKKRPFVILSDSQRDGHIPCIFQEVHIYIYYSEAMFLFYKRL